MSLNLESVGQITRDHHFDFDWKTIALYALGIGATEAELDYLYEKHGPKAYPTFAMVPNYPVLNELLDIVAGPYERLLHGAQSVTVHRPLPTEGQLTTRGKVDAIYDVRVLAQVTLTTETYLAGELTYTTEWQMYFRGEGGFGGPRRPKVNQKKPLSPSPAWTHSEAIPKTQALLYRLSGDENPLHADPEVAREAGFAEGPILHGLCTFGYACRAVVINHCQGDAARLRSFSAEFKKPVWPGDTLVTNGRHSQSGLLVECFAGGRKEPVLAGAAEFFSGA